MFFAPTKSGITCFSVSKVVLNQGRKEDKQLDLTMQSLDSNDDGFVTSCERSSLHNAEMACKRIMETCRRPAVLPYLLQ